MGLVYLRAASFMAIIALGIWMNSSGFVPKNAGQSIKKIMINITLPAAIIGNFSAIESVSGALVAIVAMGLLTNVIMLGVGVLLTRKKSKKEQALMMLGLPAYNIGTFALPFVQGFLPALGGVAVCMFDVGNSVMCTGVNYAFTAEYVSEKKEMPGLNPGAFLRRLLTSVPLVTYACMFLLSSMGIHLPEPVLLLLDPVAKANTFMAMLMLGLLFHLELKREYLGKIIQIVILRNAFAGVCAAAVYFLLPLALVLRQALVIVLFAPMSAVAPAYIGMCGGDEGMASCANSVTIIFSLVIITGLMSFM